MGNVTFILKCFFQFSCTNLDGCQKEGSIFLNLLQKEGGSLRKGAGGGGSNPGVMVNPILKIISISHCLDITYISLYLIFRHFIFIDAIKTVTLFLTYTLCNNFIFKFNLEKVQGYRRNNSIQAGKVNSKL